VVVVKNWRIKFEYFGRCVILRFGVEIWPIVDHRFLFNNAYFKNEHEIIRRTWLYLVIFLEKTLIERRERGLSNNWLSDRTENITIDIWLKTGLRRRKKANYGQKLL
jgi:hypothetical protein